MLSSLGATWFQKKLVVSQSQSRVSRHCTLSPPTPTTLLFAPGLNNLLNIRLQRLGLLRTRPAVHDVALGIHEKLLEVPLHALETHEARFLVLEPFEYGLGFVAVDVYFAEDGEGDSIVHETEFLDLVVGAWVLATELVAGETEEFDLVWVFLFKFFVEFLESFELRGEAAFGGGVDYEDGLAFEVGEVVFAAFFIFRLERVERSCRGHVCSRSVQVAKRRLCLWW